MKFLFGYLRGGEASRIYLLAVIAVFAELAYSFIDTIWALYIDSLVHSVFLVGVISSFLSFVVFVSYFFVIPLVERRDKVKLYLVSLLVFVVAYLVFSFTSSLFVVLIVSLPLAFFEALRRTSFGIIVKDFSSPKNLSKNEGALYAVENISWVLGPLIAGYVLSGFGFGMVFLFSALFTLGVYFVLKRSRCSDMKVKKRVDGNMWKNFCDFFRDSDRVFAYLFSGGVSVWWVLIYVFIPVYVVGQGYSELLIGYFLFAVAIPLVLTETCFGMISARFGFKRLFRFGYLIVAVVSLCCFFVSDMYVILAVLVLGSFGLAMLEPTTEAYFFDVLSRKQYLRFYGPFNTADSFFAMIAKLGASCILFFLEFRFVFVFFAVMMFSYFVLSFFMKDVVEARRG
jgi:MFS family permease